MRSEDGLAKGIQAIENRIDRDAEYMGEDPLAPLVLAIHQGKRSGLLAVREDDANHWETLDQLRGALTNDLELVEFVQVQAMINAIEWGCDNYGSL